jgi:hypothetical protein
MSDFDWWESLPQQGALDLGVGQQAFNTGGCVVNPFDPDYEWKTTPPLNINTILK